MTSAWTAQHLSRLDLADAPCIPEIDSADRTGLAGGTIYWDMWPIADRDGRPARLAGRELWMVLSAPERGDQSLRHFEAKIRLLERVEDGWRDLGPVLPDFDVPYEREWAGSAVTDGAVVSLYFTAAGTSERAGGYQQQLYETHGEIGPDGLPCGWQVPRPSIVRFSPEYMLADRHEGAEGTVKAFRDPAWFRDPANGAEYLVFTASLAGSDSDFNGAVGIARKAEDGWELLPPIIHADGVNNELERAHVVFYEGRYYVFWATQRHTFSPELRDAPNGIYGMVADTLFGEYKPLNGSGLVLRNPEDEPAQTYSWFVTGDLEVSAFVNFWGLGGQSLPDGLAERNACFGGTPAPMLRLSIDGDSVRLAEPVSA